MRPGTRVRVLRGAYQGREGIVQAVSIDGAAVRLEAHPSAWPFPEVRVIDLSALERLPQRTRRARLPAQEAPF